MKNKPLSLLLILSSFLAACNPNYVPKPRGYFRIDLPEKQYTNLEEKYPFSFQYPEYGSISQYSGNLNKTEETENWINIDFPEYRAHLYLTFKRIDGNLGQLIEDSHSFVYKHVDMADAIVQTEYINNEKDVYGVMFDIKGNTATSMQFYVTDSLSKFLRGAFYFDCEPNVDSLAPLISFFRQDVEYLMQTFSWN